MEEMISLKKHLVCGSSLCSKTVEPKKGACEPLICRTHISGSFEGAQGNYCRGASRRWQAVKQECRRSYWKVCSPLAYRSHSAASRMSANRMAPRLLLYIIMLQWWGWKAALVITSLSSSMLVGLMSTTSVYRHGSGLERVFYGDMGWRGGMGAMF